MARLIYSMLVSSDGYTEDERGKFGWGAPEDEAVHAYVNELGASVGTYLFGRRMYEVMVYWEGVHPGDGHPQVELDWARHWQAAEKVVYSTTLAEPSSARTRIERTFDAEAVRRLVADASRDVAVAGPTLAAQALRAGLVDEVQAIVCPVAVGGGKPLLPRGLRLDLDLLEARAVGAGVAVLRYAVRR